MRPLRHAALWLAGGWLMIGFLVWASLAPVPASAVLVSDKLLHVLAYLALALWFGGLYERQKFGWIALGLVALGLMLEIAQGTLSSRTMDGADMLANTVGVLAGLAIAMGPVGRWCTTIDRLLTTRSRSDG